MFHYHRFRHVRFRGGPANQTFCNSENGFSRLIPIFANSECRDTVKFRGGPTNNVRNLCGGKLCFLYIPYTSFLIVASIRKFGSSNTGFVIYNCRNALNSALQNNFRIQIPGYCVLKGEIAETVRNGQSCSLCDCVAPNVVPVIRNKVPCCASTVRRSS